MTARRWFIAAAVGLLLLAASFGAGRYTAPVRTVEKTVTVERHVRSETKAETHAAAASQATAATERVVWRTRTIVLPDGTRETTREGERGASSTTDTRTAVNDTKVETRIEYRDRIEWREKTVDARRPDWHAGALVGVRGLSLRPQFGGVIERRVLGSASVGLYGIGSLSGLDGAGLALTIPF